MEIRSEKGQKLLPEYSVITSPLTFEVVDLPAVTVGAGEVGEDRVLQFVRADGGRILPGAHVKALLPLSTYLDQQNLGPA